MASRYPNYERRRFGAGYGEEGRVYEFRPRDRGREDRGFIERTADELRSWFGDEDADRRRRWDERGYWRGREPLESLRAGEVMTPNARCVRPDDPVEYAARIMRECDCGAIPVVDNIGRLVGMITDRDITMRIVARGRDPRRAIVDDCMTGDAFACHVSDSLKDCMRMMARHQIRRIPIVDDRDRVVGIISQSDLARHAGSHPGTGERRAVTDVLCAVSEPTYESRR